MSVRSTLFLGGRLWKAGEVYANPELVAGNGFSSTTGIAGFPNGEMYRVDNPAPRLFILTVDDQVVINPGYNRDRGPVVNVFPLRGHTGF